MLGGSDYVVYLKCIAALLRKGVKGLTCIRTMRGRDFGIGLMLKTNKLKTNAFQLCGENAEFERQMLTVSWKRFDSQEHGERIRAGGAGIPIFHTYRINGTEVAEEKETPR